MEDEYKERLLKLIREKKARGVEVAPSIDLTAMTFDEFEAWSQKRRALDRYKDVRSQTDDATERHSALIEALKAIL